MRLVGLSLALCVVAGCGGAEPIVPGPPDLGAEMRDAAPPPPPPLRSPAEAEDTDPDPGVVRVALTAAPLRFRVGDDEVDGFAYNSQVPGPTIRARRGDRLIVDFRNQLDAPTTMLESVKGAGILRTKKTASVPLR